MLCSFWAGFLGGLGSLAGVFLGILAMSAAFSGEPSDNLFRDLLAVDIALLIAYSVALAAYVEAGHSGGLVRIGLYWIIGTSALLGVFIAFLPYAAFNWNKTARED